MALYYLISVGHLIHHHHQYGLVSHNDPNTGYRNGYGCMLFSDFIVVLT